MDPLPARAATGPAQTRKNIPAAPGTPPHNHAPRLGLVFDLHHRGGDRLLRCDPRAWSDPASGSGPARGSVGSPSPGRQGHRLDTHSVGINHRQTSERARRFKLERHPPGQRHRDQPSRCQKRPAGLRAARPNCAGVLPAGSLPDRPLRRLIQFRRQPIDDCSLRREHHADHVGEGDRPLGVVPA